MALEAGGDSEGLWELTAGNPFFLTELLAADHESVPSSIREAVMGTVARLSPSFTLAGRSGVRRAGSGRAGGDRCGAWAFGGGSLEAEAAGVIEVKDNALTFRHELARRSVEADLRADQAERDQSRRTAGGRGSRSTTLPVPLTTPGLGETSTPWFVLPQLPPAKQQTWKATGRRWHIFVLSSLI